jgi:hypothetical protein
MTTSTITHAAAVFEPAAPGTRVRVATLLLAVVVALGCTVPWIEAVVRNKPLPWPEAAILAVVLLVVLAVVWLGARIKRYEIADGELRVVRRFRTVRFPIAGLADVAPDPNALRGAIRMVGNDGFGAITGRFRSRKLGKFRAYITDDERAVVLRWPERSVVISPERPFEFIQCVRRILV